MTEQEQLIDEEVESAQAEEDATTLEIKEAFTEGLDSDMEEDDIKMKMIQAGATFKNVTRLYNQFMIDAGLAISSSERKQIVDETLSGRDLDTEEAFDQAVADLVEAVKGATERSAGALIRAYGKKEDVEVFAKPKSESSPRNPFVQNFHSALIENPMMTQKELKDLISSLDPQHQVNPMRWFNQHDNIRRTANAIAKKYQS